MYHPVPLKALVMTAGGFRNSTKIDTEIDNLICVPGSLSTKKKKQIWIKLKNDQLFILEYGFMDTIAWFRSGSRKPKYTGKM